MKEVHNIYESSMKEVHNIYESSVKEVHNIYEETKVPTRTLNNNNNNNFQTYTTVRDSLTVKKSDQAGPGPLIFSGSSTQRYVRIIKKGPNFFLGCTLGWVIIIIISEECRF